MGLMRDLDFLLSSALGLLVLVLLWVEILADRLILGLVEYPLIG